MAQISISFVEDVLVFEVAGSFNTDELLVIAQRTYPQYKPKLVLWDFSRATTPSVNPDELRHIARTTKKTSTEHRFGGMTAYVSDDPSVFNMLCMYALVATMEDMPVEQSIFRNRFEALQWLRGGAIRKSQAS